MTVAHGNGWDHIANYLLHGTPPPSQWLPIQSSALVDVAIWGNLLMFMSYTAIPIALWRMLPFIPNRPLIIWWAVFIQMCGIAHLLTVWAAFSGHYGLLGVWCMLTGIVSWWTAAITIDLARTLRGRTDERRENSHMAT